MGEQIDFLLAWRAGQNVYRYAARGFEYEVNFQFMRQKNVSTGQVRQVRVQVKTDLDSGIVAALDTPGAAKDPDWDTYWHLGGECRPLQTDTQDVQTGEEQTGGVWRSSDERPPPRLPRQEQTGDYQGRQRQAFRPNEGDAGGPRQKKYSFNPKAATASRPHVSSKQAETPANATSAGPRTDSRQATADKDASTDDRHKNRASADSQNDTHPPGGHSATQQNTSTVALPAGVKWPSDHSAYVAAAALFAELNDARKQPLEQRRSFYKAQCLTWHPDKNLEQEDLATEVFQFLQALRGWYFS